MFSGPYLASCIAVIRHRGTESGTPSNAQGTCGSDLYEELTTGTFDTASLIVRGRMMSHAILRSLGACHEWFDRLVSKKL